MSTPDPGSDDRRSLTGRGSGSIRWRLWVAMLALVLVPTAAGIYLTTSLFEEPDVALGSAQAQETMESAAGLLAREQAIEARLQMVAADPAMARLADGIDSPADKRHATRLLGTLRGDDRAIITGVCIVRSGDGRWIPLTTGSARDAGCAAAALRRHAAGTTTGAVTRGSADEARVELLMLATPVRSVAGRTKGVLLAEVDVAELFGRTRMLGSDAVTSMLVDLGSSEVVAETPVSTGRADGAVPTGVADVKPYLAGIVADSDEARRAVAGLGQAPVVVPLWPNGNGSNMGLVQLWPIASDPLPIEVRLALLVMLAGGILAAIALVRYFLNPFEEMADARAELQSLYREARGDALADGLTGLGNHRAFQETLQRQSEAFEKGGAPFSLLLLDLDDLKEVNDRDGHAAGDEVLLSMAQTMRDFARHDDMLFRTGGDEFAIILPETDVEGTVGVAERMLHFCRRPSNGARPCPFSGGISSVPALTREPDMVYRQADAALYWAKRHGRGSVEVFTNEHDQLPDEPSDAPGRAVREVLAGKLLRPVFQPIVDLRTGHFLGFEGLIRPDPDGPLPDTARLFAAAAASGHTVELDLACIEAVVNGARAIGPDRLLTLNLSPRTLEVKDFDVAWLARRLVTNGISPSRVIVELTEREQGDDLGRLQEVFHKMQQYGLRLAADDVGAGDSGLRLLSKVQFDIVKIDLSLVHDGVRRLGSRAVLTSLRDLAHSQKVPIVAEGVETLEQLKVLRKLDIGAAQGFLLGRPDASVDNSFVDLAQLESGVDMPQRVPTEAWPTRLAPESNTDEGGVSDERRAIFLPSTRPAFNVTPRPAAV